MLNLIPKILPSGMVKHLMDMGHGDEIVIGDGNFPAYSLGVQVVPINGRGSAEVLEAILRLMPLDLYAKAPYALMAKIQGDTIVPELWDTFRSVLRAHGYAAEPEMLEREAFYTRSRKAFCIAATSEAKQYGNIILTKGIVK